MEEGWVYGQKPREPEVGGHGRTILAKVDRLTLGLQLFLKPGRQE